MSRALDTLGVGEWAMVSQIEADQETRWRLLDLGLVPGTKVEVVRKSPLGDPTLYKFRSTTVALRKSDAEVVKVEVTPDGSL